MPQFRNSLLVSLTGTLVCAVGSASAGFAPTMYPIGSGDPSTWGFATQIASLDSSSFDFQNNSGFEVSFGSTIIDTTRVRTNVYRFDSNQSFVTAQGTLTTNAGDLVFAYTISLVGTFPGLAVGSLVEAQVIGAPDFGFGQDPMAASLINAQGYVTPAHLGRPDFGNIDDAAEFGSSLDFEWTGGSSTQLDNAQTITLLMFTDPAAIGTGVVNLISTPGQTGGITGLAEGEFAPPVLIPIVPPPGVLALSATALVAMVRTRRLA